jgi:Flp pilus assembly protein TadG
MRPKTHGERGAALIEFVVLLGVLPLLALGIVEFGSAWNNKLKVETAARAGARVASALGTARLADFNVLQSVKAALNAFDASDVSYVVVYKATTADGAVPAGCGNPTPTSQTAKCNVYTGAQLFSLTQSAFTGTTSCAVDAPDRWWCPTTRQNIQHLGSDYVGVWIKASSPTITDLFGSPLGLESNAVMRVEPR